MGCKSKREVKPRALMIVRTRPDSRLYGFRNLSIVGKARENELRTRPTVRDVWQLDERDTRENNTISLFSPKLSRLTLSPSLGKLLKFPLDQAPFLTDRSRGVRSDYCMARAAARTQERLASVRA